MPSDVPVTTDDQAWDATQLLLEVLRAGSNAPAGGVKIKLDIPGRVTHLVGETGPSGYVFFKWSHRDAQQRVIVYGAGRPVILRVPKNRRSRATISYEILTSPVVKANPGEAAAWFNQWGKAPRNTFESDFRNMPARNRLMFVRDGLQHTSDFLSAVDALISVSEHVATKFEPGAAAASVSSQSVGISNLFKNLPEQFDALGEDIASIHGQTGLGKLGTGTSLGLAAAMAIYDIASGISSNDDNAVLLGLGNAAINVVGALSPVTGGLFAAIGIAWGFTNLLLEAVKGVEWESVDIIYQDLKFLKTLGPCPAWAVGGTEQHRYVRGSQGYEVRVFHHRKSPVPGIAADHRRSIRGKSITGRIVVVTSGGYLVPLPKNLGLPSYYRGSKEAEFDRIYKLAQSL